MEERIQNTLRQLGLTDGETEVYLALLSLGSTTTGKIMKTARISNSKVYEVLDKLINKGLASYTIQNNKRHYAATPATRLIDYLDERKQEISDNQEALRNLIPRLETIRREKTWPESAVYRGKKGALVALGEVIEAGMRGEEILGFGTEDYATYFPAQLPGYLKIATKHRFKERLIFGEGFKSPNKTAKIRYLPKEYIVPARTMIFGSKVAIVDFTEPMTTVIIDKQSIADSYKNQFNLLWKIAGRPRNKLK
ncbi:MAG: helix-turn-helix domain-containing protein [Nanoarchaeota archaeon]